MTLMRGARYRLSFLRATTITGRATGKGEVLWISPEEFCRWCTDKEDALISER